MIILPKPILAGKVSLEESIEKRRSVREYLEKDISEQEISQILWAAQGITQAKERLRSAPSAGGRYPMEIYIAKSDGLFKYFPVKHELEQLRGNDLRPRIANAALGQEFISQAAATVIIAAVYLRVTSRYEKRGIRYVDMEAGHIAQNIHLQAAALGLGSIAVGAFSDELLAKVLDLPEDHKPIYLIPAGHIKQ